MKQKMTPQQIKHALEKAGYSQTRVGHECGVTQSTVNRIINNTGVSHKVRCFIADIIGRPVTDIWEVKPNPTKRGRPDSRFDFRQESSRVA